MARKNTLKYPVVTGKSLSSTFTTDPTIILNSDNISYQINVFTSDSIGSFAVEVSDDYVAPQPQNGPTNAGKWSPLVLGGGTPAVSASDTVILVSLNQVPFAAIRLTYTAATPGTGTCDITLTSKQLGG